MVNLCSTCKTERAALRRPKTFEQVCRRFCCCEYCRCIAAFAVVHEAVFSPLQLHISPARFCSSCTPQQQLAERSGSSPAMTGRPHPTPANARTRNAALPQLLLPGPRRRGPPHHHQPRPVPQRRACRGGGVGRQGLDRAGAHAHAAQRAPRV